jgi:serine/threonine protein kinase
MGEVYRARDSRLGRDVAIKVLPPQLSASPESRQRFEREARTISQLSHPHVCALYDVGREGENEYLVMEFLEGETLSARLTKGQLPLEQTLRYGHEIADALDKAHRQGIVHRDLKPANVMLTKSGVKLLDFGLAKSMAPTASRGSLTSLPTQQGLTQEGAILGTFQYMAPEQLEGKQADVRTDIFALGAVLYEMATGRKAFSGASQASLISSILTSEPPSVSSAQPATPQTLDRAVRKCLAKDPEERWQNASDLGSELAWIGESTSEAAVGTSVRGRRRSREWLAWALASLAILIAAGALLRSSRPMTGFTAPMRSSVALPDKSALRAVVMSPDGTRFVCVARDAGGRNLLWIRSLDSANAQPVPGTENPSFPFWSPDGRSLGFFADGKLKRIDTAGGPSQTLADAPLARGGSWSPEGVILFTPFIDGPLYQVSASGGPTSAVTKLDPRRGESTHRWPVFLPDGRHFLYLATYFGSGVNEKLGIYVRELDRDGETFVMPAKSPALYVPSGHLLFLRQRQLVAQPFDATTLRIQGEAVSLTENLQYFPQTKGSLFSASRDVLVYQPNLAPIVSRLVWMDRGGREVGSLGATGDFANPRISPDGKRIALDITDYDSGNVDVWVYQASGGAGSRITSDPAIDADPVWSPDGEGLAFTSFRGPGAHPDIYLRSASGAGIDEVALASERGKYPVDWSPDGRFILYRVADATSNHELWLLPVGRKTSEPRPFLKGAFGVTNGQFSPDGRWVA